MLYLECGDYLRAAIIKLKSNMTARGLLFGGGYYSRAASDRGNTVIIIMMLYLL